MLFAGSRRVHLVSHFGLVADFLPVDRGGCDFLAVAGAGFEQAVDFFIAAVVDGGDGQVEHVAFDQARQHDAVGARGRRVAVLGRDQFGGERFQPVALVAPDVESEVVGFRDRHPGQFQALPV